MSHKLYDHAAIYDEFYKELTHGHHIEILQALLGEDLARLVVEYEAARAASTPDHTEEVDAAKSRLDDASDARLKGRWRIDRYDAPIEWYASKLSGKTIENFHEASPEIQQAANRAMKRDKKPTATEFEEVFENLFTTQGVSALWNQSANAGTTNSGVAVPGTFAWYNNAQAVIGVGDSSTAATNAQFDLQAASNRLWVAMDVSYPTLPTTSSNAVVYRSTFGTTQANYAWNEFAIANDNGSNVTIPGSAARSAANGSMLDRVVSAQGTKASGQTWQPSMTLSIS